LLLLLRLPLLLLMLLQPQLPVPPSLLSSLHVTSSACSPVIKITSRQEETTWEKSFLGSNVSTQWTAQEGDWLICFVFELGLTM
jgi:hypothetical protein